MTIGDTSLLDFNNDYETNDVSSISSSNDGMTEVVYFVALTLLGIIAITTYKCRKEIGDNWRWSRQQSPTLQGTLLLMMKSVFHMGLIHCEIDRWEQSLSAFNQKRSDSLQASARCNYKSLRARSTDHVEKAAKKVMQTLFTKYIQKGKILEIGANELIHANKSYLCKLAPEQMQKDFVFSDIFIPESLSRNQRKKYRQIDITKISSNLKKDETFSNIVALSVIDTISRTQLPKVAEELSSALKLGGRVIVLSDLLFDQGPFAEKHSEGDKLVIPVADSNTLGGKVISIEKLKMRVNIFGGRFVKFLDNLLMLSPTDRFNYLMATQKQLSLSIVSVLGEICSPDDYELVDHRSSYIEDLQTAFANAGHYNILENGYHASEVEEDGVILVPSRFGRTNIMINHVSVDVSTSEYFSLSTDPTIPRGKRTLSSTMYAMVLEKTC